MSQDREIEVSVRSHKDGDGNERWFVYWQTPTAVGSRGVGFSRDEAVNLAERIRSGEEPV